MNKPATLEEVKAAAAKVMKKYAEALKNLANR